MNKKQERNLKKAKQILSRYIESGNCRDWDNLFENGYNDANSLIWELYCEARKNPVLKNDIRKNSSFIPTILYRALFLEDENV